jgi:hypothetical protein
MGLPISEKLAALSPPKPGDGEDIAEEGLEIVRVKSVIEISHQPSLPGGYDVLVQNRMADHFSRKRIAAFNGPSGRR